MLVAIVGAGRSGTNLLALAFEKEGPRFRNLYENRYVWTYRQRDLSCDNRTADEATPAAASWIRSHLAHQRRTPDDVLVDKTPSNALRIPFLAAVMPDVKVVNIIRDGRDNVVSRTRQWDGQRISEDPSRRTAASLAGKARILADRVRHLKTLHGRGNLPLARVPAMLADNVPALALHLLTGRPRRYAERVAGLAHILRTQGLDAAAAAQWRETVMTARTHGRRLGAERYLEVRYEALVDDPAAVWGGIMAFLEVAPTGGGARYLRETVRPQGPPAWLEGPSRARILGVEAHLRPTLEHLGYEWDAPYAGQQDDAGARRLEAVR